MKFTDFLGREIREGDEVIYCAIYADLPQQILADVLQIKGKWVQKMDGGYMEYKVKVQPRQCSRDFWRQKRNAVWLSVTDNIVKVGA